MSRAPDPGGARVLLGPLRTPREGLLRAGRAAAALGAVAIALGVADSAVAGGRRPVDLGLAAASALPGLSAALLGRGPREDPDARGPSGLVSASLGLVGGAALLWPSGSPPAELAPVAAASALGATAAVAGVLAALIDRGEETAEFLLDGAILLAGLVSASALLLAGKIPPLGGATPTSALLLLLGGAVLLSGMVPLLLAPEGLSWLPAGGTASALVVAGTWALGRRGPPIGGLPDGALAALAAGIALGGVALLAGRPGASTPRPTAGAPLGRRPSPVARELALGLAGVAPPAALGLRLALGSPPGPLAATLPTAIVLALVLLRLHVVVARAAREARRRAASEARSRALVDNLHDQVLLLDSGARVLYQTPSVARLLGYAPSDLPGRALLDLVHDEDREEALELWRAAVAAEGEPQRASLRAYDATGALHNFAVTLTDLRRLPEVGSVVLSLHDETPERLLEAELRHRARHDPLTGLPNRVLLAEHLDVLLRDARHGGEPALLLLLDVDGFQALNDTFGHDAGDEALRRLADRLANAVTSDPACASCLVARLAADEFAVAATLAAPRAASGVEHEGAALARRLLAAVREPLPLATHGGRPVILSACAGVATARTGTSRDLLAAADLALHQAKGLGEGQVAAYEPRLRTGARERLELEMELRDALDTEQFLLYYQPIVDLQSLALEGAEALLRWQHPRRGLLEPAEFIALAEHNGAITAIGRHVLQEATMSAGAWQRRGLPLAVSVNVSARQLELDSIVDDVAHALHMSLLEPSRLVLEVTETALMRDPAATASRLEALRRLGARVAVDDFGTGYASFAYLRDLPVDIVKIDATFVRGLDRRPEREEIVRTLVHLGNTLGLTTVAEGVETTAELDSLRRLGCRLAQGYLFGRPLPLEALDSYAPPDIHRSSAAPSAELRERAAATRPRGAPASGTRPTSDAPSSANGAPKSAPRVAPDTAQLGG